MTEPVITNEKIVGVNDTVTMSDAPEMLDARLYVFEGQNFVSEKDYRVAMRNYSIRDADADRLQAQVDRMTVELYRAREAGRREGLLGIAGGLAMIKHAVLQGDADAVESIVKAMIASVDRELIDSPEVE